LIGAHMLDTATQTRCSGSAARESFRLGCRLRMLGKIGPNGQDETRAMYGSANRHRRWCVYVFRMLVDDLGTFSRLLGVAYGNSSWRQLRSELELTLMLALPPHRDGKQPRPNVRHVGSEVEKSLCPAGVRRSNNTQANGVCTPHGFRSYPSITYVIVRVDSSWS